jgi:hypothetical protein
MAKKVVSKQFSLKLRDFSRGFIMAVLTPMLYIIQEMIPGYNLDPIVQAGLSAGISYLIKNFLEPTKVIEKV